MAPRPRSPLMSQVEVATLERMYRDHRTSAYALAMRLLGDRHLAEDAVQQAFMQIIPPVLAGDLRVLDGDARMTVLRNTRWAALTIQGRRRSRAEAERRFGSTATAAAPEEWVQVEARLLCEVVLGDLPAEYRAVLRARYVEQVPDSVAAARLGIGVDTYRYRLRRAVGAARHSAQRAGLRPRWTGVLAALRLVTRRRRRPAVRLLRPSVRHGVGLARPGALALLTGGAVVGLAVGVPRGAVIALQQAPAPAAMAADVQTATETPDDVLLYSAATAGNGHNATIVAVGLGGRCACSVLLRSADGGATWQSAPGPPQSSQLTLPPGYPRDPRIFAAGADADVMAAAFGAPFTRLPVPPGPLALDPALDHGRAHAFVAAADGVWDLDVAAGQAHRIAATAPLQLRSATALAGMAGVLVLGVEPRSGASVLLACGGAGCNTVAPGPRASVDQLAAASGGGDANLLVAFRSNRAVLVSTDAGHHFTELALPVGTTNVASAVMGVDRGGAPALWALVSTARSTRIVEYEQSGWRWVQRGEGAGGVAAQGTLVALPGGRVLDLLPGRGLLCLDAAGAPWWTSCPAA